MGIHIMTPLYEKVIKKRWTAIAYGLASDFIADSGWIVGYDNCHQTDGEECRPTFVHVAGHQSAGVSNKWDMDRSAFIFDCSDISTSKRVTKAIIHFKHATTFGTPGKLCFVNANGITLPCQADSFSELRAKTTVVASIAADDIIDGDWNQVQILAAQLGVINLGGNTIIGIREEHEKDAQEHDPGVLGYVIGYNLYAYDQNGTIPYLELEGE